VLEEEEEARIRQPAGGPQTATDTGQAFGRRAEDHPQVRHAGMLVRGMTQIASTLKESADGASLIFLFNYRTLLFDPLTLQLTHNLNHRIFDILGSTVLLYVKVAEEICL